MPRKLKDWLDTYLAYTERSEPPTSYHLWTGISTIAAALQKRVYIKWYMGKMYPNMFVVLVGPSGSRKGTAIGFGQDLVRRVQKIKVAAQKVTEQQLIRDIKETVTQFTDPSTNSLVIQCAMTVMSGEFAVFLGTANVDFLATLTNMYDNEEEWEYRTKHQGQDKISGICLNVIAGTAPDWIRTMIPEAALGGGFTSRIIWVVEWEMKGPLDDPTPTKEEYELRDLLLNDLKIINSMAGEFKWEKGEITKAYKEWYEHQVYNPPHQLRSPKFDGYCSRRAANLRKLMMILSASRSAELVIRIEDFERAKKILESTEVTMPQAFQGMGKAKFGALSEAVFAHIIQIKRPVKHSELMRAFFPDIDSYSLNIVMETLLGMKVVELIEVGEGDKTYVVSDPTKSDNNPDDLY